MRFALFAALLAATDTSYLRQIADWRASYEKDLKAPDGWLSVAGLIWLHEGANTVGRETIWFTGEKASWKPVSGTPVLMKIDTPVNAGDSNMTIIKRGDRYGVRLRDSNAEGRLHFTGCKWFPASERWRVKAKWVAWPAPKTIAIVNVLGMKSEEPSPGYAEFALNGHTFRLEPVTEEDHLFFMFKDLTGKDTTYPSGRFLYATMPANGTVELDFNKAENPPCAFTAFATCPLPPKRNALPIRIEAGEKRYH